MTPPQLVTNHLEITTCKDVGDALETLLNGGHDDIHVAGRRRLRMQIRTASIGDAGIHLTYSRKNASLIVRGLFCPAYAVSVSLVGSARFIDRGTVHTVDPGSALMMQPHERGDFSTSPGRMLHLLVEPGTVQTHLEQLLGFTIPAPPRLGPILPIDRGPGRSFTHMIAAIESTLQECPDTYSNPMLLAPLTEALINGLLTTAEHPWSEYIHNPDRLVPTSPAPLRRALENLHAYPHRPFTVGQLAAIAGISTGALRQSFHRYLNTTPTAYLRQLRLEHAHKDLCNPLPGDTVEKIAHRWGFPHPARFACYYQARYHQLPSHTLHRRRASGQH